MKTVSQTSEKQTVKIIYTAIIALFAIYFLGYAIGKANYYYTH
jgi:hypothetical protein